MVISFPSLSLIKSTFEFFSWPSLGYISVATLASIRAPICLSRLTCLVTMKDRAEALGGKLRIDSRRGSGTKVELEL